MRVDKLAASIPGFTYMANNTWKTPEEMEAQWNKDFSLRISPEVQAQETPAEVEWREKQEALVPEGGLIH